MIARLSLVLAVLWAAGFGLFMLAMPEPPNDERTDAIVVPTGGAGRIDRGLLLLQHRAAKRMLITGVAPQVRPIDLAVEYRSTPALFACCVDLGHEAVDTRSNADETARWVKRHRYHSVRLVTSDWHLPRARLELTYALGNGVTVIGDGVPSNPRYGLLISEYNKFLVRRVALWTGVSA